MCNTNIKRMFVLFLFLEIQASYGMPQGFFSQRFSFPKVVSWNNDRSLTFLPNVKVESPVKNSYINIFGKKNTIDNNNVSKKEETQINVGEIGQANEELKVDQIESIPATTNYDKKIGESNNIQGVQFTNVAKDGQGFINKNSFNENTPADNHIGDITTESFTETTTDEYETTTTDDDIFNRASPQLVASLLG